MVEEMVEEIVKEWVGGCGVDGYVCVWEGGGERRETIVGMHDEQWCGKFVVTLAHRRHKPIGGCLRILIKIKRMQEQLCQGRAG